MKSVVQAAWLLTTALGDVVVVIVAGVKLFNQVSLSALLSHFYCLIIVNIVGQP